MKFKCPKCSEEMTLEEEKHICPTCDDVSFTLKEAEEKFEEGELVGFISEQDEADLTEEELETTITADLDEDIAALVKGEDLSEEFKESAKTIMTTAINAHVDAIKATLEEEKQDAIYEAIQQEKEELVDKVDDYLDHVVTGWLKENEVAVEAGIKSEMNEEFLDGLAELFKNHYFDVPEDRYDVVEGLAEKVEELQTRLDESIDESIENKKTLDKAKKVITFAEVSEGLADTQKEKLSELAESIEATDSDDYAKKLEIIKENYFDESTPSKKQKMIDGDSSDIDDSHDDFIAKAVSILNRKA